MNGEKAGVDRKSKKASPIAIRSLYLAVELCRYFLPEIAVNILPHSREN
jgi:hypothetical protein